MTPSRPAALISIALLAGAAAAPPPMAPPRSDMPSLIVPSLIVPSLIVPSLIVPSLIVRVDASYGNVAGDTDYLLRLGMLEGHMIVGHDLLAAKQGPLALPHFGHPVRELYDDISEYLEAKNFAAFDKQLVKLEAAVASAPYAPDTEAQYKAAIATVHRARELAPADLRASVPAMMKICADTLDAASGEYSGAIEKGRIQSLIEYHDSRGYVSWVGQYLQNLIGGHPDAAARDIIGRMKLVLAKAEWIVEPLMPGSAPRASVGQYRAVAAEATALTKN
jgi:hypothetical protein